MRGAIFFFPQKPQKQVTRGVFSTAWVFFFIIFYKGFNALNNPPYSCRGEKLKVEARVLNSFFKKTATNFFQKTIIPNLRLGFLGSFSEKPFLFFGDYINRGGLFNFSPFFLSNKAPIYENYPPKNLLFYSPLFLKGGVFLRNRFGGNFAEVFIKLYFLRGKFLLFLKSKWAKVGRGAPKFFSAPRKAFFSFPLKSPPLQQF